MRLRNVRKPNVTATLLTLGQSASWSENPG
jgi:hypothetical protein